MPYNNRGPYFRKPPRNPWFLAIATIIAIAITAIMMYAS